MTDYTAYFLGARADIAQLELMEFSHPSFTQPYRIVRNKGDGVTVDLNDDEEGVTFDYYPAAVTRSGARDDLDSGLRINFGDLGEVLPPELDEVTAAGTFSIKPQLRYWVFRSDVLTAPIYGPLVLEAPVITFNSIGATIDAKAPSLNSNKTGERYTLERFPMQRGFV